MRKVASLPGQSAARVLLMHYSLVNKLQGCNFEHFFMHIKGREGFNNNKNLTKIIVIPEWGYALI